ncbi:MAG TPA: PIN domain-containing protein [Candidatus Nanoarchaeia archaeon]|nr:PIN domain-containing protein [Candidatus Nanoarchaeia archaeon]
MRFIDSNIIAYAFYQNEYQDNCQNILRGEGITNTIALVEAFNIIEFESDRDTAMTAVRGILRSNLEIVDIDVNIIFETLKRAGLCGGLKFIDLLHYTVASLKKCESILSYDKDFDNLEIGRAEE